MSESSNDDDLLAVDWFQEPAVPEKPHTYETVQLENGEEYSIRLVGSNPLWGHHLWNGARVISRYLLANNKTLIKNKNVLELGAGGGLPSLVCASHGARSVVVTDYPDADLIENLAYNIEHCTMLPTPRNIAAKGYLWGNPVHDLPEIGQAQNFFDTVILADLLFNHSEHRKLMNTIKLTLARTAEARALVFFTPYRPWLLTKDLAFFDVISGPEVEGHETSVMANKGWTLAVRKLNEEILEKVMFEEDRGDELLRRTVYSFELLWADLQSTP